MQPEDEICSSTSFFVIEDILYNFVQVCRAHWMPVNTSTLRLWALLLQDEIVTGGGIEDEEVQKMKIFTGSKGWAINYAKRHALWLVTLFKKGASANVAAAAHDMSTLRKNLSHYSLNCIFNMEKTGLYYEILPRRTYICSHENRSSVKETKAMEIKDRNTAYDGTSATVIKVPMCIIGTVKNPRCFRIEFPAVSYLSQRIAWSDTKKFIKWFYDVSVTFVRRHISHPAAVLMNNRGPHGAGVLDSRAQMNIFTLPTKCTSVHQPVNMGIISA